jgi:hypothetical protein
MATTTNISLVNDGGTFVPSLASVPVVSGDIVTFSTSDGSPVVLFFSPEAALVLSPRPYGPLPIGNDGKGIFTFTSSNAGAYSIFFSASIDDGPSSFPGQVSKELFLEIGSPLSPPFTGSSDSMRKGN